MNQLFWSLDLPAVLAATLASLLCGLLGNFLLVRRAAMLGDAISHAILPGIVGAFLLFGTRNAMAMVFGAAAAGVLASGAIEVLRRVMKVERSAATGVVFCTMFAVGVVMLERAARNVDLDADCVLYGLLEGISWTRLGTCNSLAEFFSAEVLATAPRQIVVLAATLIGVGAVLAALYKVLVVCSFDAGLADALGFRSRWVDLLFAALVAMAAVASFEAVGSILVIAMLICPAAAAARLSNRLKVRIGLSVLYAVASSVGGYALAVHLPRLWASSGDLTAPGMMAALAGALLVVTVAITALREWLTDRPTSRSERVDGVPSSGATR